MKYYQGILSSGKSKTTTYRNAISTKFDNRRVTVVKDGDGYTIEFRKIDRDFMPHQLCELVHGKLAITTINLSKEAAEVLMVQLADMIGVDVIINQCNKYK